MKVKRLLRHLFIPGWWARRVFGKDDLHAIRKRVTESEAGHRGELRFVAEGPLPLFHVLFGQTPRQRAVELFGQLRVWDTEENCGILIYVQLVDRRVEILADRGVAARVPQAEWNALCRALEQAFKDGAYREGVLHALQDASRLLATHFPAEGPRKNELPDAPILL